MTQIFPYDRKELVVNLQEDILKERLKEFVYLKPTYRIFSKMGKRRLVGHESNGIWQVYLKSFYRNSFKPEILIHFQKVEQHKTKLTFEFRVFPLVRAFFWCWSALLMLVVLIAILGTESFDIWFLVFPVGMFGIALVMIYAGFSIGMDSAESYFDKALKQIIADSNIELS